jgi:glycosyltransferase involved in cell wall biosynthesis
VKLRLLCVSHPCVTPANQEFFARVERRTGWDLAIVVPKRWKNEYGTQAAERWPAFGGSIIPVPVVLAGNIPLHFYAGGLTRQIRRWRPDALFMHHEPYGLATFQAFRTARRMGIPAGFYSAQNLLKTYPWPIRRLERTVHSTAAFALPVSEEVADVLRAKGYRGPLQVLPLGVDTSAFAAVNGGPPDRPFTLGYVGRLADEKGVDTLLEALALLRDTDARCVIAGDGPARTTLEELAGRLGVSDRVEWTGYVPHDEVPRAYAAMDMAVIPSRTVPSWKEQFGRVVLEALATETPVIVSDSGELPRLTARTGGGWTFPEGDPEALAGRVRELLTDRPAIQRAAAAGAANVRREYDLDVIADRFAAAVENSRGPV